MKNYFSSFFLLFSLQCMILVCYVPLFSQNETKKWYFGNGAGLDFMTSPPSILTNGQINSWYSGATISNGSGNLLFYTDGVTVWNSLHLVMANGSSLTTVPSNMGNLLGTSGSQGAFIVKKPLSNNLYYIFSQESSVIGSMTNSTTSIYYAIVDMSLAAGQGSVTLKNVVLWTGYTSGRMAATMHCNGSDIWLVTKEWFYPASGLSGSVTPNFRAYLLTSTGINTTAVISAASTINYTFTVNQGYRDYGCLKFSPNGKKLGAGNYNMLGFWNNTDPLFEIFDFDKSTGIISNQLTLFASPFTSSLGGAYGCEFSPDGTKFYGTQLNSNSSNADLRQWNLCAGTNSTAIIASSYTIPTVGLMGPLQLASNGKIYGARWINGNTVGAIDNPNGAGAACNYVAVSFSLYPKSSSWNTPNFVSNYFYQPPPSFPFTYTVNNPSNCLSASFSSPYSPGGIVPGCPGMGTFSLTGMVWNFGDPASGPANLATIANPIHAYTAPGTYTAQLILYYSCGGGTDTIKQPVTINAPILSFNTSSVTCASLGSATAIASGGTGPFSYTWMPGSTTGTTAGGLSPGTQTITVLDAGLNCAVNSTVYFSPLIPLSGSIAASPSIICNGANTATGSISNLAGGSGSQNYLWTNGTSTSSVPNPTNLSAGTWSVNVTDALTACQVNSVLTITQPPTLTLNISSSSPSACAGTNITFTASNSGGTPAYTYTWVGAGSTTTITVSQALAGNYVYTVNSRDANLCLSTKTIAGNFVPNPTLAVSNVSICPLETGTLTVSGASSYTWNASISLSVQGISFTASPVGTQQYSVLGSALGCSAAATASIIVKPVPSPTISNNSPICNAQNLNLVASGGVSYLWSGPLSFISSIQNPSISSAAPANSGVYNVTVTGVNSCTAPASTTVVVNPTPTISLSGGGVCINSNLYLSANSFTGSSYLWSGPNSFSSSLQNPTITAVTFSASGIYSLLVTSIAGCNNSATVNVIVNSLPSVSIAPSSTVICVGKLQIFWHQGQVHILGIPAQVKPHTW